MQPADISRAIAAAREVAASRRLLVDHAIVLNSSNKLMVRLLPCDVVARIARHPDRSASFEVDLARRLAAAGCPVAGLESTDAAGPDERDGFVITLWNHYAPVASREISPREYADALVDLHAGMRALEVPTPHVTDRVDEALALLADRDRTPSLSDADRAMLSGTLDRFGRRAGATGRDQLLHGEPHPGNVLLTAGGVVFIDLETCCRGPVEFDIAHAPDEVAEHYPGVDHDLLADCRLLMRAMVATWRFDRDDRFPDGRRLGGEWLTQLAEELSRR